LKPSEIDRRLLAEILHNCDPNFANIERLMASIEKLPPYERFQVSGLTSAIHNLIDRLPGERDGAEGPLAVLVAGLNDYLDRPPFVERRECQVSREFAWLLAPATHAVERLVSARASAAFSPASIGIMLKMPAARLWHDIDFRDRKDQLSQRLARWPEINDALFWSSIAAARRLREEKGERLTDDWPVQYLEHYWSFRVSDYERILNFIADRPEEDDRLVAVSLAYRIFRSSDMSSSALDSLRSAVGDYPRLSARLTELLDAPKSSEVKAFEAREKGRQRKQKRKRKVEAEERARWIRELQANPDRVRQPSGVEPGEITYDHLWLLAEIEKGGLRTNRHAGSDWRALIPEFGDDVALAYRDAAISQWRTYTPVLRSEGGETDGIPYAVIFGLVGLEIETQETEGFFVDLSEDDFRHMLRYATWELNGFPTWLEVAEKIRGDLVLEAFRPEISWEIDNSEPNKVAHHVLHDIVYHAPWLHQAMVVSLLDELEKAGPLHSDTLRYALHILRSGGASGDRLAQFARARIERGVDAANLASLYALWVDTDANNGTPALETWFESQNQAEASTSAQLFVTALMGGRHGAGRGPAIGSYRSAPALKHLYVLMHRHIRASEDIERAGAGVYSPVLRDDAQDGRNSIFNLLADIPGKDTYTALTELTRDHPNKSSRTWMGRLAYRRAEADGDLAAWSASDVAEFDQSGRM
jgi:hypothetical protein